MPNSEQSLELLMDFCQRALCDSVAPGDTVCTANMPAEFPEAVPEFKAAEVVEVVSDPEPDGVIESYTFQPQKGAARAVIVGRQLSDGRRWVGVADPEDADLLEWFEKADPLGEQVVVYVGERNIVRRRV